ncbi:hypothetical protein INR49_009907, partial [Caranx melampygus]
MQLTHLEAAVILGIVIPHISSISISSAPPDCVATLNVCMSDLCVREWAFNNGICKTSQQKRSTLMDWKSSSLTGYGTSHMFSRHARQICATLNAASELLNISMAACRTMLQRCWACVSVRIRIRGCLQMKSVLHSG